MCDTGALKGLSRLFVWRNRGYDRLSKDSISDLIDVVIKEVTNNKHCSS